MDSLGYELSWYLRIAWLLPLLGFAIEVFGGYWGTRKSKTAAYMAIGCIAAGFVLSTIAFCKWNAATDAFGAHEAEEHHASQTEVAFTGQAAIADHPEEHKEHADEHAAAEHPHEDVEGDAHHDEHHAEHKSIAALSGTIYSLGKFGDLEISIDYYIDSLTILMFMMVTLIATCIHIFAIGYMSDELTEEYVDHHAHTSDGRHVHRPGRFYRFFSYFSLFCFSMLGIVFAGNIFQVFVFWELVGICSFLLIGFYTERKSANVAANKAFIVNRVGDFGFIIGLMILWTYCGTFKFGDYEVEGHERPGLFSMVRGHDGELVQHGDEVVLRTHGHDGHWEAPHDDEQKTIPYMLLVVAGLGVFGGCVGKSAQFPLQTWLPDAMEGPTPVSALVHSATMVAAGVYLAGRFFPVFTTEVLLAIAYTGCITLFVAATIAIVATDIKKVLAYSTISQLGYMMLAIGLGGWAAGLFHLITHAFFKSLMFLCSGSVIHGCHHEQEMPKMGGLRHKMPITAYTMLIGVIAIAGLAIPGTGWLMKFVTLGAVDKPLAFSGFHSKDAIVATALAYTQLNPLHFLLFLTPLVTAGITAFYMFRLWFYTFSGSPRDQHVYDHCHESPKVMWVPLVVLSFFAAFCAANGEQGSLFSMLSFSEPVGLADGMTPTGTAEVSVPSHHAVHAVHSTAGAVALLAAVIGTLTAYLLYCRKVVDPEAIKTQFSGVYNFLVEKWQFDNLYDAAFVRPSHSVARWCSGCDRNVFDAILHGAAKVCVWIATIDRRFDEGIVDGLVNLLGNVTRSVGLSLSVFQTGRMRQYVMFIAVGVVALFALLFAFMPKA
ncbi:MAG: NADH-quinone oxidoreductase subunit L [Planctomycetota bacterium]|jgi:NADH-quinone oxidoreductase subunit L